MEFVIENIDINKYSGEIIFYWLERNITFIYGVEKIKQKGNRGIIKLDYKLIGTYKIGHNLRNKINNDYEEIEINIYSENIKEISGGILKRLEWLYFCIVELSKDDVVFDLYNKDKFREKESDTKKKTIKLNTEFWRNYWKYLHYLSFIYPINPSEENKKCVKKLLKNMENEGLTCPNCRMHFRNFLVKKDRSKIVNNKENLINFFIDLHNDVNSRLGKGILSKKDVKELYNDLDKIRIDLINGYGIDMLKLLEENRIKEFPNKYNNKSRKMIRKRLGLFVLEE